MAARIESHADWPIHTDILNHPPSWLASRQPIWYDLTPVDTVAKWEGH